MKTLNKTRQNKKQKEETNKKQGKPKKEEKIMSGKREGKEEGREKQEVQGMQGHGGGREEKLTVKGQGVRKNKLTQNFVLGLGWVSSHPEKSPNKIFWMVHKWVLGHSSPPLARIKEACLRTLALFCLSKFHTCSNERTNAQILRK